MKKFTLTIGLVVIAAFVYGQRNTKPKAFITEPINTTKKLMLKQGKENLNATYVWEEEFTDSIATGVNGLPDGWAYTPNDTNINNQWQWKGGFIGTVWLGTPVTIEETFYTNSATVPATNPTLFFNFFNSFYFSIENGQDSLYVEYESNGDGNWHWLWSNRNETALVASGVNYPYSSWDEHMARIQLPATTINQPIKFRVTASRTNGYSQYVESMALGSLANDDVEMIANACLNTYVADNDTTYFDGLYQLLPITLKKNFVYNMAAVKNYGVNSATNLVYTATFKDSNGNLIAEKDTNMMLLGSDLTNTYDIDTFKCGGFDNIDAVTVGTYTLETNVTYDNADEDTLNNYFSMDITYAGSGGSGGVIETTASLARNTKITGELGVHQYSGSNDGDQIGISFHVSEQCVIGGAIIPLGLGTTDETGFTVKLYASNIAGTAWEQMGRSNDICTSAADAGTSISVDLWNSLSLYPQVDYMLVCAAHFTPNVSKIYFSTYDGYKDFSNKSLLYEPATALCIGGTWSYITEVPCFTLIVGGFTNSVNETSLENTVKVYPNPTENILHIDNINGAKIEIYNMLGNIVYINDKASDFNTVDLSNYAKGTYLVRVYSETGIVVKKINLVE